jgi:glucose-6-phosphate 1-dehydrogenase
MVFAPEHPKAIKGFYYLHRLVMEKAMGRILESYEEIHHLLSKDMNTPEALFVVYHKEHLRVPAGL